MTHVAVTAVGADRPGIVAAVTRVFVEQGCNLEDSSMTILRGLFAMMLGSTGSSRSTPSRRAPSSTRSTTSTGSSSSTG